MLRRRSWVIVIGHDYMLLDLVSKDPTNPLHGDEDVLCRVHRRTVLFSAPPFHQLE